MFAYFKYQLYSWLVYTYPKIQAHYEGYKDSNPEYHQKHRWKSLSFLRKLRKYYINGQLGDFPKPPLDYYVKGSGIFVSSNRQDPMQLASSEPSVNNFERPDISKAVPIANKAVPITNKADNTAPVKPYMDGPESEKGRRMDAYHFALLLIKYDVISFDVFDTLILRKLNRPEDVFMLVGEKLGIFNFYGIRKKAEEDVRRYQNALNGSNETTIEKIYERVAYYTGIDPKQGAKIEFEIERDMCFANPYMLRVFEILKAAGKRIVATSNMYFQKERIEFLLKYCGYEGFEEIFVSCDYGCGKRNGDLFRILQGKIENATIVHIGDNIGADIDGAKKVGIDAKYYQACRDLGERHRSCGISWLIESAYRGIVNTTLHSGIETFSPLWEYGFVYGGLIALGYINWIHNKAKSEGITKILFLSRDGYLLKEIYDMFFDDIPSEYIFWSRIATFRNISAGERYPFLQRVILEQNIKGRSIGEMLEWVGLLDIKEIFYERNLPPTCPITESNCSMVCDVFVENWDKVETALQKTKNATEDYLRKAVDGHKSVAVVDLGWSAKSLSPLLNRLRYIAGESNTVKVKAYMIGTITSRENNNQTMTREVECYMFHQSYNREIRDRVARESTYVFELIEKMFNAPHCSFLGFSNKGDMEFAPAEIDNYKGFSEIGSGILDFCTRYYNAFKEYPYLFNIDGYDAFIPLRLLINNKDAALSLIGKLSYNIGIVPSDRKNLLTAFGGKK